LNAGTSYPERYGVSVHGDAQDVAVQGPEQPAIVDPVLRAWARWFPEVLSVLSRAVNNCHVCFAVFLHKIPLINVSIPILERVVGRMY